MSQDNKNQPRQWWIQGGRKDKRPDWVSESPAPELIHVIEKSAYDELSAKLALAEKEIKRNYEIVIGQSEEIAEVKTKLAEAEKEVKRLQISNSSLIVHSVAVTNSSLAEKLAYAMDALNKGADCFGTDSIFGETLAKISGEKIKWEECSGCGLMVAEKDSTHDCGGDKI